MEKYRIRLTNGRIIGPFSENQLLELQEKSYFSGKEEAQVYPTGEWGSIKKIQFLNKAFSNKNQNIPIGEETFVLDLSKLKNKQLKSEEAPKPEIPEIQKTEIIIHQEPTILMEDEKVDENKIEEERESSKPIELELNIEEEKEEKPKDKLEIVEESNSDKTVINPQAQKELQNLKKKLEQEEEKKKKEKQIKEEEDRRREIEKEIARKEQDFDGATQFIKIDQITGDLIAKATVEEKEIIEIEKKHKKLKEEKERKEKEESEENENDEENEEEEEKAKKKKLLVLVLSGFILYAVLFPEKKEEAPPFKFIPPQIEFPIPFDKADVNAAKVNLEKGKELFTKGNYPDLVKSGGFLKNSFENNLENFEALNLLLRNYGEQLKYSKSLRSDGQVVFNLIQSKRPYFLKDPNGAIGLNLFYSAIGKHQAAVDITARYLKLNPKNITQDLFAVYLKSLIKVGKLELARQIFTALDKSPDKNKYSYEALIEYLNLNQEIEKANSYLDDALKKNPNNVMFQLMKAEVLIKERKFKETTELLKRAEKLALDNNDVNRAKFLELTGVLLAAQGKVKEATIFLESALKIGDSQELRERLAELNDTGGANKSTDKLIAESKAIKLLNQAKEFFEKNNLELALSYVAKATDAFEGHIPSELFLAKVQLKLGQAELAIKTIEALLKKHPENKDVNFAMIEAYIDTYKFNDAKNRIAIVSSMEMKNSWEFASLNAKMYRRMGNSLQAVQWLKTSINMNPLNDQDIYNLAEVFIKRNNFESAQLLLTKCIELDPTNPDYRIAYSKIIYEKQDDQAAVGYLLELLNEFGENPRILGEIAIFYFRSGKVKDFEAFKERISKLPQKDKFLYEFLIRAALLDERFSEIPKLVEDLLKIEPGDLESMMTAGRVLFEEGKLKESAFWFKRVQDRLSTYPKVQYYVAKIKMLAGEIDDAVDESKNPIKDVHGNPILGALNLIKKDIKENGENDITLVLLGEIYVQKGELIEAENTFKRAQKINPKSYEALVGLADISTKRNNYDLALDLYQKAMLQKSDEPVLHKKIGDVYRLLGQGALAIESYKMYLEMDPDATDKAQIESFINLMK